MQNPKCLHIEMSSAHDSNSDVEPWAPSTVKHLLQMRKILLFIPPCLSQKDFPVRIAEYRIPLEASSLLLIPRTTQIWSKPKRSAHRVWLRSNFSLCSILLFFLLALPLPCFSWESFLTCSVSAKQRKPRQRKPIKIWARGPHNFSVKGQRVNTFRLWEL